MCLTKIGLPMVTRMTDRGLNWRKKINHFTDVSVPCTNCEFKMLMIEIEAFCLNLEGITSLENLHFLGIKGISPQHSSIYTGLYVIGGLTDSFTHICALFPY